MPLSESWMVDIVLEGKSRGRMPRGRVIAFQRRKLMSASMHFSTRFTVSFGMSLCRMKSRTFYLRRRNSFSCTPRGQAAACAGCPQLPTGNAPVILRAPPLLDRAFEQPLGPVSHRARYSRLAPSEASRLNAWPVSLMSFLTSIWLTAEWLQGGLAFMGSTLYDFVGFRRADQL